MEKRTTWFNGDEVEVEEVVLPMADTGVATETGEAKPRPDFKWLNLVFTILVFGGVGYGCGYVHGHLIDRPRLIEDIRGEFDRYGLSSGGQKSVEVKRIGSDGRVQKTSLLYSETEPGTVASVPEMEH